MAHENITTSLNIDVSQFKKNIAEANKAIKLANAEFKAASAGMDNWEKSTEGISAKLTQLNANLEAQKNKLDAYKRQLEAAEKSSSTYASKADELRRKLQDLADNGVSKTSDEYKTLEKELAATERAQSSAESEADRLKITFLNQQGTVNALERDIRTYNGTLNDLESRSDSAEDDVDDLSDSLEDAGDAAEKSSGGFTVLKGALADLVADGFRRAIGAAKDFATSMVDVAAEIKAENSQYAQTFGDMADQADAAIGRVANSSGILDTRLRSTATGIYAFAMSSGADSAEAMELMETALMATADSAAYYDRSLEDTAESLQSFLKGNYANDQALGVSATETTRNAAAMDLFGKKFNDLTEVQKQQTLLKMVTDAQSLSGAMGQAAREADGWENVQGNLNETWRQFKGEVGQPFLEALIPIIKDVTAAFKEWKDGVDWDAFGEKISSIVEAIKTGFGWILENKDYIIAALAGIVAGFLAFNVVSMIVTLISTIKSLGGVVATVNAIMAANPIGVVATAIGLLVAAITLLIQNWDTVKEVAVACWEAIKEAWNAVAQWFNETIIQPIVEFFTTMWDGIKTGAENVWNAIKNIFVGAAKWFYDTLIKPVTDFFTKMWNGIKNAASSAWNAIKNVWNVVSGWFNDTIITPIQNFFTGMWDKLKSGARGAWDGIKSVFSSVANWFKDIFSRAWNNVKNVFSTGGKIFDGIKDGIANVFKTVVNGIIGGINRVIAVPFNAINSVLRRIKNISILGLKPFDWIKEFSVPQIPTLARGGVLKKGEVGLLEGDGAEAVIPLDQNKKWIAAVADEMEHAINGFGGGGVGTVNNSRVNNFTQVINAPKMPSRLELYRQTRNLLDFKGV